MRYTKPRYLKILLGVTLSILSTLSILLVWEASQKAEQVLTEKVKTRELIIARAGARALEHFVEERKTKLLILSKNEPIRLGNEVEGRAEIEKFIDKLDTSIARIDKNGLVSWSENPLHQKVEEGVDVSDRSYFQWAKNQKSGEEEVFVSKPLMARTGINKGKWVIIFAAPLYHQEKFNGVLIMAVSLEELAEEFVVPLTISPESLQMIVTKDGTVVASNLPESLGTNLLQTKKIAQKEVQGLEELAPSLLNGKEGSLVTEVVYDQKPIKIVVGYAPVKIGDHSWYLLVEVPYQEVKTSLNPFLDIQNKGLVLLLLGIFFLIAISVFSLHAVARLAYEDGYRKARKST